MKKRYFTLVELLVVVGIVVILAGLVLPAVIGGAQQGRITQAKSDMKAIQMALAQMDQTYGKMMATTGSGSSAEVKYWHPDPEETGNPSTDSPVSATSGTTYVFAIFKDDNNLETTNIVLGGAPYNATTPAANAYRSLIAELTGTGRSGNNGRNITYNTNVRKIKFLDPKTNFDPGANFNSTENQQHLWIDPWGNQYVIMVCVDGSDRIIKPESWTASNNIRYVMGKTAVYSFGPNGENNSGKNASEGGDKLDDDIATWHK